MLELEPETDADPVRYFCTPENAEIIGWGSCGTHFVLLPGDEAVYCVEPELAEEGTFVLPVGADFREFLSHLFYCKCTSPLAQIFMLDATRFRKLLEDNDANTWPGCEEDFKSRDASLDLLAETFHIRSRDPFQRVKELQTGFDPSVLNFSASNTDLPAFTSISIPSRTNLTQAIKTSINCPRRRRLPAPRPPNGAQTQPCRRRFSRPACR